MIKDWLNAHLNPLPSELVDYEKTGWQRHYKRIVQTEYMFTSAPGYYKIVEESRRISILGANDFFDNTVAKQILAMVVVMEKRFQDECYRPAKAVEALIARMNPIDPASVAATRAEYNKLDKLSRSSVANYELLTRAEGFVNADGSDKVYDNIIGTGMRKPVAADGGFTAEHHARALYDLQEALPGAHPWYIWIVGNQSGQMRIDLPNNAAGWAELEASGVLQHPIAYYQQMGISLSTDVGAQTAFFTYLDTIPGAEVYVQVENMNRMVEPQMDVVRYLAEKFECVKGFAMDIEWYNHNREDCGLMISDYRAKMLNEYLYSTWGPEYSLCLKHYSTTHIAWNYRGGLDGVSNPIIFCDDTQNYGSHDGSHGGRYNPYHSGDGACPANGGDWAIWADTYYPNPVVFQTGYQHDTQWTYAYDRPVVRSYSNKISEVMEPDQDLYVAWVNFNRNGFPEFPNGATVDPSLPGQAWRTYSNQISELATRSIAYLSNYPAGGYSNNLLGRTWGYRAANGPAIPAGYGPGFPLSDPNEPHYFDARYIYNVRQYFNDLVALGGAPAGFTGHTNYPRFVAIEPRAFDIMVSYHLDIVRSAGGYIAARDAVNIDMLINMHSGLTTAQKAAVTKEAEFWALLRMAGHSYGFRVLAGVKGPDEVFFAEDDLEYTVWIDAFARYVNTIEIKFTINDNIDFDKAEVEILEAIDDLGFGLVEFDWNDDDPTAVRGRLTLGITEGAVKTKDFDLMANIIKLKLSALRVGGTVDETVEFKLDSVILVSHEDNVAKAIHAHIVDATSTAFVYSKYDLNRDGVVDVVDLGIALLAIGWSASDAGWDTFVVSNNVHGRPITPALIDVAGNGVIDTRSVLDILMNYTGW